MKKKLFAFWRYDKYPYVLGGTITEMSGDGMVITQEYGYGFSFKPLLILPVAEGRELLTKLKSLEAGYREAQEVLRKKWFAKALELTPIVKG